MENELDEISEDERKRSTRAKIGVTIFMIVIVIGSLFLANLMRDIVKPQNDAGQDAPLVQDEP